MSVIAGGYEEKGFERWAQNYESKLRELIEGRIREQPRGMQKTVGASELGTECLHCLAAKLACWDRAVAPAWIPFIGSCVHSELEHAFRALNVRDRTPRYLTEYPVTVGVLEGACSGVQVVRGHVDLFDTVEGVTVDWKIVGANTLKRVKLEGASQQYRVQASLYGLGLVGSRFDVRSCGVYFLPRNAVSLQDGVLWAQEFDADLGRWALERAQRLLSLLDMVETMHGVEQRDGLIRCLPRASHCFDCGSWLVELGDRLGVSDPAGGLLASTRRALAAARALPAVYEGRGSFSSDGGVWVDVVSGVKRDPDADSTEPTGNPDIGCAVSGGEVSLVSTVARLLAEQQGVKVETGAVKRSKARKGRSVKSKKELVKN